MIGADSVAVGGDFSLSASGPVVVGGINCQGNEERLQDCPVRWWGEGTCDQEVRYASVDCTGEFSMVQMLYTCILMH